MNVTAIEREVARLAEVDRLNGLNATNDPILGGLVDAAVALFDVPIALVTLVGRDRRTLKAARGFETGDASRESALYEHAIQTPDEVVVISDARADPRFAADPLVAGEPWIRFYAAAPLLTRSGFTVGAFCLIDRRPRTLEPRERRALRALAASAMRALERRQDDARSAALASFGSAPVPPAEFVLDADLRVASWSGSACALLGWTELDVVGRFPPFILAADAEHFSTVARAARGGAAGATQRCWVQTKDGRRLEASIAIGSADDARRGIVTIEPVGGDDDRRQAEHRLAILESVVVNSTDAVIVTDASSGDGLHDRIIYVNDAFTRMTGYSSAQALGQTPRMLQGPATDPIELARIESALGRREPVSAELTNYRRNGTEFRVELNISPVNDSTGTCRYFIAVHRETTVRHARECYERDRRAVLEMLVRSEPLAAQLACIVVLLKDVIPGSRGAVMLVRDGALFLSAADPSLPQTFLAAIDGIRTDPELGPCMRAMASSAPVFVDDIGRDFAGSAFAEHAAAAGLRACWTIPLCAADGTTMGAFALYMSSPSLPRAGELELFEETVRFAALVVDRHRDRAQLERMARYDALTGLPNRISVEESLDAAMLRAQAAGTSVAVGVLDLDRFKAINDAFGHSFGDALLQRIARRLSESLRAGDTIGRMSGDEFVVVFADLANSSDGIDAAMRLLSLFDTGFDVDEYELVVRPSFGLALYPTTATQTTTLLQAADKAMYGAKLRGGGLELATTPIEGTALKLLDLEQDLRHALERREFALHYQLIFDLDEGRPVGAEALLRWNHPQLGLIAPADFIPLAESNGTIVTIGTWAIGEAARVARTWQVAGHDAFVTVNVSALQFDAPGLIDTVVDALERNALEPRRLHLELTESLVMRNPAVSAATLTALKALGVRIVIDDFGTGYSSLAYLQRFSFDTLKIDRAFVRNIGAAQMSERSEHIVTAVVHLAAALGVTTIAEGVEDAAQYAFVQSCGCTAVQGFLCARPVPAADLAWERPPAAFPRLGAGRGH